ncbi:MAG: ABC transporter permease, partial [Promethearchaeota archaeon]
MNKISLVKIWALSKKNIQLYIKKGPVLIFGLMFPFFMVLSWVLGREISPYQVFVGIISMTAFFTSTAI